MMLEQASDIRLWYEANNEECPRCHTKWMAEEQNIYPHWTGACLDKQAEQIPSLDTT